MKSKTVTFLPLLLLGATILKVVLRLVNAVLYISTQKRRAGQYTVTVAFISVHFSFSFLLYWLSPLQENASVKAPTRMLSGFVHLQA